MIELRHLRKAYPNAIPLKDVNVTIHKGDVIAVIGPSGTGKSTLIRCINQLDKVTSGAVLFEGKDITDPKQYDEVTRRKIGMVFQSFNLFGHMTVLENVMYVPVHKQKLPKAEAYEQAMKYLKMMGMDGKIFNYPSQLSGGQKQRVAIARTLATEPELIMLDEPTSALDPTMAGEVEAAIHVMAQNGATMMIVTHSMHLAQNVANRVFYMDDGGIYEEGTPEQIFEHPQKPRTQAFINQIRTLTLTLDPEHTDALACLNQINNFTMANHIPLYYANHIVALVEEICLRTLLPRLGTQPNIQVCLEYLKASSTARFRIRYNGDPFDLQDTADPVIKALITHYSQDYQYRMQDGECPNTVALTVK